MNDPKVLKWKQAAQKATFQTRPGPALISVPEKASAQTVPLDTIESPKEKKKTVWSKIWKFCRRVYQRLQLKHLGLVFVTIAYAFFGGWLFSWLERDNEIQTLSDNLQALNESAHNLSDSFIFVCNNDRLTEQEKFREILRLIETYQNDSCLFPSTDVKWDLWGGMFFAGTVFTTIGYGHYVPVTTPGRIAVMIYALIGIPLVLAMLTDFGKLLTNCLNNFWSRLHYALSKCWKVITRKEYLIPTDTSSDIFAFPIPLALILIIFWILFCSSLFCIWETTWDYFKAFYFFFISLSTIGLGDITPAHPKYMICAFPLVLIGLSLVSLVINLIQNYMEKLKEKTTGFVEEQFGLDEETESEGEGESGERTISSPEDEEKKNRTALGIIQTLQRTSRARRRRIGVQTEESYLRECQIKDNESMFNTDASSFLFKLKKGKAADTDKDKISLGSFDAIFYDARDELLNLHV